MFIRSLTSTKNSFGTFIRASINELKIFNEMASSTQLALFITLSVMAITGVYSQMGAQSQITQFVGAACTVYRETLVEEGPKCSPDVIEELIDELDNVQTTVKNWDEEIVEEYLKQATLNSLCYANGMKIKKQCELMESVCTFGNNIIACKDVTPAPATLAPGTNAPTAAPATTPPATT